jgi:hypothetical protein
MSIVGSRYQVTAVKTVIENATLCVIVICKLKSRIVEEFHKSNYQSKRVNRHLLRRTFFFRGIRIRITWFSGKISKFAAPTESNKLKLNNRTISRIVIIVFEFRI